MNRLHEQNEWYSECDLPIHPATLPIHPAHSGKYNGKLDKAAAEEALEIYAEVVADAKAHRGSHPNIDIMLDVLASGSPLDVVVERG